MITVSMIVKNEESNLKDCLNSVKDFAGEIVIADTGSTDSTIEIAESFGAKIRKYEWENDFAAARNFALDHSTGKWILYIDADERVSPESVPLLKKIAQSDADCAYYCFIHNVDEIHSRPSVFNYPRLFPNRKNIRFEGAVHEQIEPALKKNEIEIKQSDVKIIHLGYSLSDEQLRFKAKRNLAILIEENQKHPSGYNAYQIGQTYGILGKKTDAEKWFTIALTDNKLRSEYKSVACRYLASVSFERGDNKKAYELIRKSINHDNRQPLALLMAAKICNALGQKEDAVNYTWQGYKVNTDLLSRESFSHQTIFLDAEALLSEVLLLAYELKDKILIEHFTKISAQLNPDLLIFYMGLKGEISLKDDLFNLVTSKNSELVLYLIRMNPDISSQIKILTKLSHKYPDNIKVLSDLALLHKSNNNTIEAESIYEKIFSLKPSDPSVIFYLTSLYLQNGRTEKIPGFLIAAKEMFNENPEITSKIDILEQKLAVLK